MAAWTQHPNLNESLTARQREVLGLIAAGRTNPEIAEALGVSLAGAKWHVSEVISRLGVETREEAAEVWRDANALPRRFVVWVRGIAGVGLLKATAGAAATVAVAGAGVGTIAVVREMRTDEAAPTEVATVDPLHAAFAAIQAYQAQLAELLAATQGLETPRVQPEAHPSVPSTVAGSFAGASRNFDILVGDAAEDWPIGLRADEGELSWIGYGGNVAKPRIGANSSEDMFGVATFASPAGFSTIYGAVSSRVVRVEVLLEDGRTATVTPQVPPPGTAFPYNVFGAAFPGTSWIQEARAFDATGSEVGFYSTAGHPTNP